MTTTSHTPAALNLDWAFTVCAEYMEGAYSDGEPETVDGVLAGFEDAHGVQLTDADRAALTIRLGHVARALATYGAGQ